MKRRAIPLVLIPGMVINLVTQPCRADQRDWTFCYAANVTGKAVYVTNVFESSANRTLLEAWLREQIAQRSLPVQNVSCPAPSAFLDAQDRHETARRFIESLGYKFLPLN